MEKNNEVFEQILDRIKSDVYISLKNLSGFLDSDSLKSFVDDVVSKLYKS